MRWLKKGDVRRRDNEIKVTRARYLAPGGANPPPNLAIQLFKGHLMQRSELRYAFILGISWKGRRNRLVKLCSAFCLWIELIKLGFTCNHSKSDLTAGYFRIKQTWDLVLRQTYTFLPKVVLLSLFFIGRMVDSTQMIFTHALVLVCVLNVNSGFHCKNVIGSIF